MRHAPWGHCYAMRPKLPFLAIEVHEDLTLKHIECLVYVRVLVERRHLAPGHDILE